MRILLVEADVKCREELTVALKGEGLDTVTVDRGLSALDEVHGVDLVLLDLSLPDIDGFEVCRRIRAGSGVPIIIVSGRSDEFDHVLGLKMGADDYVVKPCRVRELIARIEAVMRRARSAYPENARNSVRELGVLRLDLRLRRVMVNGEQVALTRKEFGLLALLTSEPGRIFAREEIMTEVWGHTGAGDTRTLGVHMAGLRKKLGVPDLIETVRGVGFAFVS
jgi:two-component system, OmpR family, response regulator RegX3